MKYQLLNESTRKKYNGSQEPKKSEMKGYQNFVAGVAFEEGTFKGDII